MVGDEKNGKPSPDFTGSGHRKRLRERFLSGGLAGFHDYEIIELLLSLGTPRRDCKQQAKEAIKRFRTLRGVLAASPRELQQIKGIGPHSAFGIKLVQEVAREFLKEQMPRVTVIDELALLSPFGQSGLNGNKIKPGLLTTHQPALDEGGSFFQLLGKQVFSNAIP